MPLADVLSGVDAYVLTHLHPDHFDMAADGTVGAKLAKRVLMPDDGEEYSL